MKAFKHFNTITKHKIHVTILCFKIGLYKQGILHDLSKYTPTEFITGIKYYKGYKSPNSAEREEKGYSEAWLHHKGRNKHHWEYWVDFSRKGLVPARMPERYVLEMFCDRVAASKVYKGKDYQDYHPLEYYKDTNHYYIMHPETRKLIKHLLEFLSINGLEKSIEYIKKNKNSFYE